MSTREPRDLGTRPKQQCREPLISINVNDIESSYIGGIYPSDPHTVGK